MAHFEFKIENKVNKNNLYGVVILNTERIKNANQKVVDYIDEVENYTKYTRSVLNTELLELSVKIENLEGFKKFLGAKKSYLDVIDFFEVNEENKKILLEFLTREKLETVLGKKERLEKKKVLEREAA